MREIFQKILIFAIFRVFWKGSPPRKLLPKRKSIHRKSNTIIDIEAIREIGFGVEELLGSLTRKCYPVLFHP